MKLKISGLMVYYENFNIKVGDEWYFITREKLEDLINGIEFDGKIVRKRTRTWIE